MAIVESGLGEAVSRLIGPIASLVTVFILGGFLTFFLLLDGDKAWATLTGGLVRLATARR